MFRSPRSQALEVIAEGIREAIATLEVQSYSQLRTKPSTERHRAAQQSGTKNK